jgi:DNA-binding FadR family transcriptional regulator
MSDGGRLEVQGVVSAQTGEPLVQFRQTSAKGEVEAEWQANVADAREMAQQVLEAAMNATYDAALLAWAKEAWPDDLTMGARLLALVRRYRADAWGLPDLPEDWR